mmetsp:Transcript_22540/g.67600  ORF Transcript_22540/g.67600 Transcript_22540/m.67600 type:complete len:232 (-) Transcript_22540:77-772(-)
MPPRGPHLLGCLEERVGDEQGNGLLHLQRCDLVQLFTACPKHGRARCEVCVGQQVQLVDEFCEERLRLTLVLVLLHLCLGGMAQHLRFVLLRIDLPQADPAFLEVQSLDGVVARGRGPLRGRQHALADDVVEHLVPDPLPNDGLYVQAFPLGQALGPGHVIEGGLLVGSGASSHGRVLGAAAREVGHGLVQVHLQQGVQGPLLRRDLALKRPGFGFELLLFQLGDLLFQGP